ncbi:MAG: carboxypeptidase-like regulatory domain-containing protein [Planctomycetota bacterium]
MGSRARTIWLGLGLLGVCGLVLAAWLARAERPAEPVSLREERAEEAASASALAPAFAPEEGGREERVVSEPALESERETVAASDEAVLFGRVTLPSSPSARGRMADVRVWWTHEHGVARAGSLATLPPVTPDASGRFRLVELPLDVPLVLWAHTSFGPEAGRALAPFMPGERREVELALESWVVIAGLVLGEDSLPLEGLVIRASRQDGAGPSERGGAKGSDMTRQSGADGSFEFARLTSASWLLDFDHRPLLGGEPLVDARRGDVRGLVFVLARPDCLRVVVRWPDGTIAEDAYPSSLVMGKGVSMRSQRDGWSFCGLPAGEHEFVFSAEREDGGGVAIATAHARIPGPDQLEIFLHEPARLSLFGTVRDERGRVVPGARVQAHQRGTNRQEVDASDGLFELEDLEEGRWTVQALAEGSDCAPRELLVDALTPPQDFVLVAATEVRGTVLDADGQPVAGANVRGGRVISQGESSLLSAEAQSTGARGEFGFPVRPGKLVLTASAPGHASSLPLELELTPGETRTDVVLSLRPSCALRARVLDSSGAPVVGATLSLVGRAARIDTDAHGEATLTDLPPGRFQLRTEATGFLRTEFELDLRPGPPRTHEIILQRPTTTRP